MLPRYCVLHDDGALRRRLFASCVRTHTGHGPHTLFGSQQQPGNDVCPPQVRHRHRQRQTRHPKAKYNPVSTKCRRRQARWRAVLQAWLKRVSQCRREEDARQLIQSEMVIYLGGNTRLARATRKPKALFCTVLFVWFSTLTLNPK